MHWFIKAKVVYTKAVVHNYYNLISTQRWIKKENYRKQHMIDSEEEDGDELPAKKVCRATTWTYFLQNFSTTDGILMIIA